MHTVMKVVGIFVAFFVICQPWAAGGKTKDLA
jgi:hypothetical protein